MRPHQLLPVVASAATVQAANPLHPRDLQECYTVATGVIASLTDLPTPDATLFSYIAEQTHWSAITGSCEIPAVTGSLGDKYTSYVSSLTSWAVEHRTDFENVLSACSDVPEVATGLDQYRGATELCSEYTWVTPDATGAVTSAASSAATEKVTKEASSEADTITADSSAAVTPSSSATKTPGSSSSGNNSAAETVNVNAAPQRTGMAIAAAGMAGLALAGLY